MKPINIFQRFGQWLGEGALPPAQEGPPQSLSTSPPALQLSGADAQPFSYEFVPESSAYTAAFQAITSQLTRVPGRQLSEDPATLESVLSYFEDTYDGYGNDNRPRIIRILRGLSESDDDVHGAVGDLQSMCGAGCTVDYVGGARAIKAAEAEWDAFQTRIYPEGGGLSGLINNQVREFAVAGAGSLEWVPQKNRRGIDRVALVPSEEIRIRRDPDTGVLRYQQWGFATVIDLDPTTYHHMALFTSGRKPYGVPLYISSLFSLERKRQLLAAEQRVINLMARSALVQAMITQPTPEAFGMPGVPVNDRRYIAAVDAFYKAAARTILAGGENGLYVGSDKVDLKVHPIAQTAQGAPEVTKGNQHRVWNALGTQPFLRGEMDSTTQALAQVTIPLVYAQAVMVQQGLKRQLEFGFNLHLRLMGIPAQANMLFTPPKSPFLLDEARAFLFRAEANGKLAELFGKAWAQHAMREYDIVEDDDQRAPAWWNPSPAAGTTSPNK
ncbi:hypothetical protein [Deinococcus ruber]|uniref:Portal protein n=1 Tax=Deinococcus ruber TaxID=1848197 RepID=A0A918C971_9DEIO|nr:hypothetical protein [Deinococcus ruber]GGR11435.1 hypothetical protein GCM10008957_25290 [Deinococcus ruber]